MAKKPHRNLTIPKPILAFAKFLQMISPHLAMRFAARLFTTPIRHKTPRRELSMDRDSRQETLHIKEINKAVNIYHYGSGPKILLVHGWSGRGTQLVKFAEALKKEGFSTISFDAPAHGKSPGKTTIMPEFIASVMEMERKFGPFEAAIGHSLGGMTLLNSARQGLKVKSLVVIGSGDIIKDITDEFVQLLKLKPKISDMMRARFDKMSAQTMDSYSSYKAASALEIPVLLIHDENDAEVSISCARNIHAHLKYGELMVTRGLGHRKILGSTDVVTKTVTHIKNNL